MTPYALALTIAQAVAQDSALQAWATATFGKPMTVYLGLPSAEFPDMERDAPFVAFGDPSRRSAQDRRAIEYGLDAWMGLQCAEYEPAVIDNYIEPAGMQHIFDGLALLLWAVKSAVPGNISISGAEILTDTLSAHDWVEGHLLLDFTEPVIIGQDPLA